jgi:predicted metal-binding protein
LCCPPFSPTPEQTRQVLDCYQRALLIRCQPGVSVKPLVVALERELFLQGFYRAFALGAGPCFLCEECNLERCLHAYEARPSLEACGVDVYATARGNGMPLAVVRDQDSDQNHYGAVLVD